MSNFERRFGRYAVKNLSIYIIVCYAIGYMIRLLVPGLLGYLYLNPYLIIHNLQIWRLFTWLLVPPGGFSFITLIFLYFFYSISSSLESTWGTYRYNIYIFSGVIFTIISAFLLYGFNVLTGNPFFGKVIGGMAIDYGQLFSTMYISTSILLALAVTYPEGTMLIFFIIPIKMKYWAIIYVAYLIYQFIYYAVSGLGAASVVMAASLLNFVIFFFMQRKKIRLSLGLFNKTRSTGDFRKRTQPFASSNASAKEKQSSTITRHKCAVCGRTDVSNPELQFRFCSKCNGNYEYCEDHLFTHTHVK